ncbi:acyl carrier protein [Paenibacillus lutrae]|uniref:Carrier domain-containing protein n=1 Tax=Paenibacillus lutrae TaxID=2078573 RepID=A0A7X3FP64_9BACL|nr:acyl carrier protein [Paenibacillus lutrae]MVP02597.1 hypothetical protein [Paenibacillus lutrae]
MANEVEEKILSIFKENDVNVSKSDYDKPLDDLWGVDSISYVQILADISKEFQFQITDEDFILADLNTFNGVMTFTNAKLVSV